MAEVKCRVAGIDGAFSMEVHDHGDAFLSTSLTECGCWEPFETEIVRRLLVSAFSRPSAGMAPLFVDCGANLGWYSVVAGLLGADVVACEPMPANAALLRQNVSRNGLSARVEVYETALGWTAGSAPLHLSSTNQGDHRLHAGASHDASKERSTVSVSVRALSELLGGRRPMAMKLDTQGSEVAILGGGRNAWEPCVGLPDVALVTEFWPYGLERCGSSASAFLALVQPLVNVSHQCFEIVEHDRTLVPLSFEKLVARACSPGLSSAARGFVNLLFCPVGMVHVVNDLVPPPPPDFDRVYRSSSSLSSSTARAIRLSIVSTS